MSKTPEKAWKKRNIPLVKFHKDKGGSGEIEGKLLKFRETPVEETNQETGEVIAKTRVAAIFQKLDSDEKFQVWVNAGLKSALDMSDVVEGDAIRIVHLGQVPRGQGKAGTVNQYDIFAME